MNLPRLESVCVLGAVLVAASVTWTGCSENRREPATGAGGRPDVVHFSGDKLTVPAGWSAERIQGGLLLMAAEVQDGWQANLFLEERPDPDSSSLEDWLGAAPETLRQQKLGFKLLDRTIRTSTGGMEYACLEYTFISKEVPLREWYIVGKRGQGKKCFIYASAAARRWEQDSPNFKSIVDCLR